ncbi:hypothetical protein C8J56DRAFT_1168997 [Mycena floridula]|nr:hypothetical protein C8J56DRAFT_1168997 [Mycena floridula]
MSLSSDHESILPRKYQEEIFTQAQTENIIAALDTGSGKTYISTLLLKWISVLPTSQGKVIVFLVPKVALVEQQSSFIATHSPLRVAKLHGQEVDSADRDILVALFQRSDVAVMTAQIFLNFLTHSVWTIDKVSLMIFDECHHTRKNHPYNSIMREYFHTDLASRPKIFGMTASPIWNPKDPAGSLNELETNLDARTIAVRENVVELDLHSPKPVETIQKYDPPLLSYDYPSPTLFACLQVFQKCLEKLDVQWIELERRHKSTHNNLGPYCASLYLHLELSFRISRTSLENDELSHVEDILAGYAPHFDGTVPLDWCSPKVRALVRILQVHISSKFHGIIFVDQRQIAGCLARVLPQIFDLKGKVRCADLVGTGSSNDYSTDAARTVAMFREGELNLLIATSVAEEGLDFPACDMVVRFDPVPHLVGYVQSRGRARNKTSNFIIMVQKDDEVNLAKYQKYSAVEPELKLLYHIRSSENDEDEDEDDVEMLENADLAERERYVIASTSAFANYDNSISLINHLCALIPHDQFTGPRRPKYTGDFQSTLRLPSCLPLPSKDLTFVGPVKRSKSEAKRSVAFMAVKQLHKYQVFDDYLLPVGSQKQENQDADGKTFADTTGVPPILDILVKDPWCLAPKLWIHLIFFDDRPSAGLLTGTQLPVSEIDVGDSKVRIGPGKLVVFDEEEEWYQRKLLGEYTCTMVWLCNTASPIPGETSLYVVPVTTGGEPDFEAVESVTEHRLGNSDWSGVIPDGTLVMQRNLFARTFVLHSIRNDLTPKSVPPMDSFAAGFESFHAYFVKKWGSNPRRGKPMPIPDYGALLEVSGLPRSASGKYPQIPLQPTKRTLIPQSSTRWFNVTKDVWQIYMVLPALCHRITDVYRAQQLTWRLGLPRCLGNSLIEALTIPASAAGFSNQRLETLGDSVLKLCTTVHLFNKYPFRHEGQLTALRASSISNRYLMAKALELGIEQYIISEAQSVKTWRYIVSDAEERAPRQTSRQFPRRSLQDCMEAMLGASFVAGGIETALQMGSALSLSFGGSCPWPFRFRQTPPSSSPCPSLFTDLQQLLGYSFKNPSLLIEAFTHPGFESENPSYQRLEFLGDALVDMVVVNYLYEKFPNATSEQLARPKAKAVCSSALAKVSVHLGLHNIILMNNVELNVAIANSVPELQEMSAVEMVESGWRYSPPKALSDVFESLVGALFLDMHYDYEKTAVIVEDVMSDILECLSPAISKDPISKLSEWLGASGCRKHFEFIKALKGERLGMEIRLHDTVIAGPIVSTTLSVARSLTAERALSILSDSNAELYLGRVCFCQLGVQDAVSPNEEESALESGDEGDMLR